MVGLCGDCHRTGIDSVSEGTTALYQRGDRERGGDVNEGKSWADGVPAESPLEHDPWHGSAFGEALSVPDFHRSSTDGDSRHDHQPAQDPQRPANAHSPLRHDDYADCGGSADDRHFGHFEE